MKKINNENGSKVAQAIDNRIINVAKLVYNESPHNKTKLGKVLSKKDGYFSVEIEKSTYTKVPALRNVGEINVGEVVLCLIPNNQFGNMVILGVADGTLAESNNDSGPSLPIGMIFASAIEITDARFHLLDGGTIAKDGIYAEFATMLETLYPNGDYTTSQYESDLGAYGQCGHFVIGADTIRLPKITKFVEGLSDISDLGKSYGAGLPNISGDFGAKTYSADTDPNGAFYWSWTDWWVTPKGTDKDKNTRVQFDASTFNSIYGNSTTVQPQSTAYPYYIVLANGYKSDVQVDIDNVATELNNKADKTLSNVTYPSITAGSTTTGTADRVIKQYLSSDGLTWYRLWASGWIECGGMRSKTSGERTSVKVTLPVAFSNTNYVVASTYHENNSSVATLTSEYFGYIAQKTTTGFYLSLYGASTGQSTTFYCCGY